MARRAARERARFAELSDLVRRLEEQLEHSTRLAEIGGMAAEISHELNQPLTGIRNYARNAFYMLEKRLGDEEEVKANLRLISEQVDRAARIGNRMRELTRRGDRAVSVIDVNSVVRETVDFLMPQMRLSQVEVLTNARHAVEESPPRRLSGRHRRADRPVADPGRHARVRLARQRAGTEERGGARRDRRGAAGARQRDRRREGAGHFTPGVL
jgi:signal transduction histidine kinase